MRPAHPPTLVFADAKRRTFFGQQLVFTAEIKYSSKRVQFSRKRSLLRYLHLTAGVAAEHQQKEIA